MAIRSGQAVLAIVVVALLAGNLLGQPVLLSFVETGSMEPTIDAGDGFVAIPSAVTGEPAVGDVVVFEAREIEGGGLTTHRVVDKTAVGYVTRGDANPFTDQDGGEPPVRDAQIVATAWQVDGSVVTIPHLGTAVMAFGDALEAAQTRLAVALGTRSVLGRTGLAALLLGLSVGLYAFDAFRERRRPTVTSRLGRDEPTGVAPRHLRAGFTALVVVAAATAMLVPAGTHSYDVVSAEFESDRPTVIERGTTDEIRYRVANTGLVPVVAYLEGGRSVAVEPDRVRVGPRTDRDVAVAITAPEETGYYPTYVTEFRYLHVLPVPVIDALYGIHPRLPLVAILALLGGVTDAVGRLLLARGVDRTSARARFRRRRHSGRTGRRG